MRDSAEKRAGDPAPPAVAGSSQTPGIPGNDTLAQGIQPAFAGNRWGFAWSVVAAVSTAGFAIDFARGGRGFPAPGYPDNLIALGAFLGCLIILWLIFRRGQLIQGLGGTRLAVATLSVICLWALLAGTFPQALPGEAAPIHQRVIQAPPFVLLLLLLLANLGWGTLKHLGSGMRGGALFAFNHLGIFIVLASALFGSGDVRRFDIWIQEGRISWTGDERGRAIELPFAVQLEQFTIDRFPPQATLIDSRSGEVRLPKGVEPMTLESGRSGNLLGYKILVEEATLSAPWSIAGEPVPAARLRVEKPDGGVSEGWISCGSALMPPLFIDLGDLTLAMPTPRSKRYESRINLHRPHREPMAAAIEVNRPLRFDGWWLYQKGYDLDREPGVKHSQLEAVWDPWLPALFCGFGAMAIGALLGLGRAAFLLKSGSAPDLPDPKAEERSGK